MEKNLSNIAGTQFTLALSLIPEITQVEGIIRAAFRSDVAPMRDIPDYLLSLGGKRIRPVITLLCAKALGAIDISRDILDVAAGIELIHMATLMHDDIIDQSPIRRHKQSPYAKYGTPLTLLSGDFLLTRAFGLCAKLSDVIVNATEQACIELVEGEALETSLHNERHTLASSLTIAERKTASLFRLAATCAGHLTNSTEQTLQHLSTFGQSLGIAFQMIDDILDVTSNEQTLGKQPGLDIAERKPSLVNLLWIESGDPDALRLFTPPGSDSEIEYVRCSLEKLKNSEIVVKAKEHARAYGQKAKQALNLAVSNNGTHDEIASSALLSVVDFALDRLA